MVRKELDESRDEDLLNRYAELGDERAFEHLVMRHSSMVIGVVRRVLRNSNDAEDAFQATFLAFAKAAGQLRCKSAVGPWLHRTASRCATMILKNNGRWLRGQERMLDQHIHRAEASVTDEPWKSVANNELEAVLDEEIARLPSNLQRVIVLCDLEGLTRQQAAVQLDLSLSTVTHQVIRGRELLSERLTRRGVTLSVSGLVAYFSFANQNQVIAGHQLIANTMTRSLLYATGHSAKDVGIPSTVLSIANKLVATTSKKVVALCLIVCTIIAVTGAIAARREPAAANDALVLAGHFDNGNASVWTVNDLAEGTYQAIDGNYIGIGNDDHVPGEVMTSEIRDIVLDDVSVQVRATVAGFGNIGVVVRRNGESLLKGYGGAICHDGQAVIFRTDGDIYNPATPLTYLAARKCTKFDSSDECFLRFDAVGDSLSLTVWPVDQDMPSAPTLTAVDATYRHGAVGVAFAESRFDGDARAFFRDLKATSKSTARREMLCE